MKSNSDLARDIAEKVIDRRLNIKSDTHAQNAATAAVAMALLDLANAVRETIYYKK